MPKPSGLWVGLPSWPNLERDSRGLRGRPATEENLKEKEVFGEIGMSQDGDEGRGSEAWGLNTTEENEGHDPEGGRAQTRQSTPNRKTKEG